MSAPMQKGDARYHLVRLRDDHPEMFWVGMVSSSITITKEVYHLIDTIIAMVVR